MSIEPGLYKAVERLFTALFILRYKRESYAWEQRLGEALIHEELVVSQPPRDQALRAIHYVAEDVKVALNIHTIIQDATETNQN